MATIPDEQLHAHAERVEGKVVLITGAAKGIGKETAIRFGKYGAKLVIGDLDTVGGERTVKELTAVGVEAVFLKTNVTVWEDQLALFQLAISQFGAVDAVIANAGVSELGQFETVKVEKGVPVKPDLTTVNVNLIGTLYTAKLALHYLEVNRVEGSFKALILLGSMASYFGIPGGCLYAASKHGVLGIMRSMTPNFERRNIRIGCIHPFFADTTILPGAVKLFLAGVPKTPVDRIAGAIFYASTDPDNASNGSAWVLADDGLVFQLPKEEFKFGVYKMMDDRINTITKGLSGVVYYARLCSDLWKIFGKSVTILAATAVVAKTGWAYRSSLPNYS